MGPKGGEWLKHVKTKCRDGHSHDIVMKMFRDSFERLDWNSNSLKKTSETSLGALHSLGAIGSPEATLQVNEKKTAWKCRSGGCSPSARKTPWELAMKLVSKGRPATKNRDFPPPPSSYIWLSCRCSLKKKTGGSTWSHRWVASEDATRQRRR